MRLPSVKVMVSRGHSIEQATKIRHLMENYVENSIGKFPAVTLHGINNVLNGHGIECIPKGRNQKSPEIHYVNMGDTYDETVMWISGRFVLGSWGGLVEYGNYSNV